MGASRSVLASADLDPSLSLASAQKVALETGRERMLMAAAAADFQILVGGYRLKFQTFATREMGHMEAKNEEDNTAGLGSAT